MRGPTLQTCGLRATWTRQCEVRWSRFDALARQPVHLHSSESVPALLRPARLRYESVPVELTTHAARERTDMSRADVVEEVVGRVVLEEALLPVADVVLVLLSLDHLGRGVCRSVEPIRRGADRLVSREERFSDRGV